MELAVTDAAIGCSSVGFVATTSMVVTLACRGGGIAVPLALIPAQNRKSVLKHDKKSSLVNSVTSLVHALKNAFLVKSNSKHSSSKTTTTRTKLQQLNQWWYQAPEIARFFVSGNLGNMCFFAIERAVYQGISNNIEQLPPFVDGNKDSISFFLGYILQMGSQHLLHAWLVYGLHTINTREKYVKTLVGQSSAYFTAMIGSTVLNTFLRKQLGVPKNYALFGTLYLFAIINYFVVGWIVHRAVENSELHELELSKHKKTLNTQRSFRGGADRQDIFGNLVDLLCDKFVADIEIEHCEVPPPFLKSALISNTYTCTGYRNSTDSTIVSSDK